VTDVRRNNDAQCGGHDIEHNETDGDSDQSACVCATQNSLDYCNSKDACSD